MNDLVEQGDGARSFDTELVRSMEESIRLLSSGQADRWRDEEDEYYKTHHAFLVVQISSGNQTGAKRLAELDERTDLPGDSVHTWSEWIRQKVLVGCAYAAEAMVFQHKGAAVEAWCALIDMRTHLAQAEQFWRMKWTEIVVLHNHAESRRVTAARAAAASHAEDYDSRDLVRAHYIANRSTFPSKDDAAEKMASKLVPHKFRTVRKWLNGI